MKSFVLISAFTGALIQHTVAAPTPTQIEAGLDGRGVAGGFLGVVGTAISNLSNLGPSGTGTANYNSALSYLKTITPTATPTSPQQALVALSSIYEASPTPNNLYAAIGEYIAAGLTTTNLTTALSALEASPSGPNSETNSNSKNPSPPIYPKANSTDAPYDLPEARLRAAIHTPFTFQYGKAGAPQPVILVPGTGNTGYLTFRGSYIPLLTGSALGEPVWLNIPGYLLNDAQTNAEYVAYAINYISAFSAHTRSKVTDHVAFSPDHHGTVLANFLALGEPQPPSVLQQEYTSTFISTLRRGGGDSAYVPTTTVYSGFLDEVVEPQQGSGASAFLGDARGVGVTNNEVQTICAGQPAGGFFTHEGVLYNALGYALAVDALSHAGPGQASRLDLASVCASYLTPGLDLNDFLLTEDSIAIAGVAILVYPGKVVAEPAIKSYAVSS
ncbi:hypothetical protein B0A54_08588 [Friedmanniomyces endolithicus]|uniref:Uncharacterized protein n=1 Tax=Friedmanniomyces endolithicus TaxID=329885 RepID=A0A4V5N7E5_9PEZI|nr:hypothetical protein LTS09_010192 [Friedmanniomyces endolithicus]TKA39279.1 hypothetical protein B0A54_08588 [Friedmanniomyces endolithicus]